MNQQIDEQIRTRSPRLTHTVTFLGNTDAFDSNLKESDLCSAAETHATDWSQTSISSQVQFRHRSSLLSTRSSLVYEAMKPRSFCFLKRQPSADADRPHIPLLTRKFLLTDSQLRDGRRQRGKPIVPSVQKNGFARCFSNSGKRPKAVLGITSSPSVNMSRCSRCPYAEKCVVLASSKWDSPRDATTR